MTAAGARPAGAALALSALVLLSCLRPRPPKDDPCAEGKPALLEVRDGQGVLQAVLRGSDAEAVLCDEAARSLGRLSRPPAGRGVWLRGRAGEVMALPGSQPREDATVELPRNGCLPAREGPVPPGRRCPLLRLHQGGDLLRLLDDSGVPIGQIERRADGAAVYDPGGRGLFTCARAEAQDPGRLAIRATDGSTRFLILGLGDERAACALALPSLSLAERVVLARFLAAR